MIVMTAGTIQMSGSRTHVDTNLTFDSAAIGADADAYLKAAEARVPGIRPGLHKQIVWADPVSRQKKPIAIVYIHGFSASLGEARPYPDLIAKALDANLYFTRLTGHGATNEAMGDFTVNDWLNDIAESIAIGEKIGDRIVVIAVSTGASAMTWALAQPQFKDRVDAAIFVSPNFKIRDFGAFLLTWRGAKELAHLLIGKTRSFVPVNALHAKYWTYSYPVEALLPMAEMVKLAVKTRVEDIRTPLYVMISPSDTVVSPDATRAIVARWGGPHELVEITNADDPYQHVPVGDALSPSVTKDAAIATEAWLRRTLNLK
jgi:esterase/lipase